MLGLGSEWVIEVDFGVGTEIAGVGRYERRYLFGGEGVMAWTGGDLGDGVATGSGEYFLYF